MSRRSSRLLSGGYYNSDEESDSSSVTNISYRENPVKVFKKKTGTRKPGSRSSSRANSHASSGSPESPGSAGQSPSPLSAQTQPSMRTVAYAPITVTPRPALTPSSARGQTPPRCHPTAPEKSPYPGLSSSGGSGSRSNHQQLSQSAVDSSGYSSSEGNAPQRPTYSHLPAVAKAAFRMQDAFRSSSMKKGCGLAVLLLIALLCFWLLLPSFTKTPSQTKPRSPPVIPAAPPQPSMHSVDPAVVSAAIEAKMQHLLVDLQLKQELLISQLKEQLQLDMKDMKADLEAVDSDSRLHLEQELAVLSSQIEDHQTDSRSAAASLNLRIQTLENQNAKLSQELSSIQMMPPPPAPCPDSSTAPVVNHLTPELQQAMETWFSDRIKEQDADRGSCTDCARPVADRMADFALETQGASVISTRCSETYRHRSACLTLFGFPLWYPSESPRTVIQGYPVLLPGKCWAFHGVQGILVISLSHPVRISHVTLDHLPRCNSPTGRIDSAPKDFEVHGMKNDSEEGTLLGRFLYSENGPSTQTFKLPNPSDEVYRFVELRVLSNWGHVEYTCLYRFRVHGTIAAT